VTEAAYTGFNLQITSDSGAQTDEVGWREWFGLLLHRADNLAESLRRDLEVQCFDSGFTAEATMERVEGETSTTATIYDERRHSVERATAILFRSAQEEVFEDGIQSEFERQLALLVENEGTFAADAVARLISSVDVNGEVSSMALRALGEMSHPASRGWRLHLLEQSLRSSSYWVRDGATLGLAWMDDPTALPYLLKAAEQESIGALRQNMEAVIAQLRETRLCH
jgi:hypothetical protein